MARGSEIVVTSNPKGMFLEGLIDGTPKPGTMMQIKAATEPVNGRPTWTAYNRDADGDRPAGPVAILLPDHLQGKTTADAYVSGDRGFLYAPIAGEELNVLCANLTGTGSGTDDAFAIGDLLIPDDGTGKFLKTTGSVEIEPFCVLETVAAIVADTLVFSMYTGH